MFFLAKGLRVEPAMTVLKPAVTMNRGIADQVRNDGYKTHLVPRTSQPRTNYSSLVASEEKTTHPESMASWS